MMCKLKGMDYIKMKIHVNLEDRFLPDRISTVSFQKAVKK